MKTDSQLQQAVSEELQWEPSVHAAHIGVEVKDGVVTLAGQVDSYPEKWNAERAAQRVPGVMALSTALQVRLTSLSKRTDAEIAEAVENVMSWASPLPAGGIQVMVENGQVTLSGEVDWHFQRQAACDQVRGLMGVTGVNNQISLSPVSTSLSTSVKSDIEAALRRSAIADVEQIAVTVSGSNVTLSGKVFSWDERDAANGSAWGTRGVRNVIDQMTLV